MKRNKTVYNQGIIRPRVSFYPHRQSNAAKIIKILSKSKLIELIAYSVDKIVRVVDYLHQFI